MSAVDGQARARASVTRQVVSSPSPAPPWAGSARSPKNPASRSASSCALGNVPVRSVSAAFGASTSAARTSARSSHPCCASVNGKYGIAQLLRPLCSTGRDPSGGLDPPLPATRGSFGQCVTRESRSVAEKSSPT